MWKLRRSADARVETILDRDRLRADLEPDRARKYPLRPHSRAPTMRARHRYGCLYRGGSHGFGSFRLPAREVASPGNAGGLAVRNSLVFSVTASILLLAGAGVAGAGPHRIAGEVQVTQIPFSDWLAAQGTNIVAWVARNSSKPFTPLGNFAVVDYAGTLANANHLPYTTTATGSVTLTKLSDGTGIVRVNEDFSNAVTYANNTTPARIFGYSPFELANSSATPAFSTGHLQAVYTVPDADNAELNLGTVTFSGGGTLMQLKFLSQATGDLRAGFGVPEGTPGQCVLANVGLFNTGGGGATADAYPVEHVDVRALTTQDATPTVIQPAGAAGGNSKASARPSTSSSWGGIKALYH
jgi:hypothetical protein